MAIGSIKIEKPEKEKKRLCVSEAFDGSSSATSPGGETSTGPERKTTVATPSSVQNLELFRRGSEIHSFTAGLLEPFQNASTEPSLPAETSLCDAIA